MDTQMKLGKSICQLRRFHLSFQSQHLGSILLGMGWSERIGFHWLLYTVIVGCSLLLFTLGQGLTAMRGIHHSNNCNVYKLFSVFIYFVVHFYSTNCNSDSVSLDMQLGESRKFEGQKLDLLSLLANSAVQFSYPSFHTFCTDKCWI